MRKTDKCLVCLEKYSIKENGEITNNKSGKTMKAYINKGYYKVNLHVNGVKEVVLLHRMLGFAFIPNPENKKFMNHKDGNKLNNDLTNLEWVTQSENAKHAWDTGLNKTGRESIRKVGLSNKGKASHKTKKVINTETGEIFESSKVIAEKTGIKYPYINQLLNGKRSNNTPYRYYLSSTFQK